jgi:hypothetical protein
MAKSLHLNEFVKNDNQTGTLSSQGLWENWLDMRSASRPAKRMEKRNLDEHCIWEKAVHFEVLVVQK